MTSFSDPSNNYGIWTILSFSNFHKQKLKLNRSCIVEYVHMQYNESTSMMHLLIIRFSKKLLTLSVLLYVSGKKFTHSITSWNINNESKTQSPSFQISNILKTEKTTQLAKKCSCNYIALLSFQFESCDNEQTMTFSYRTKIPSEVRKNS